VALSPDGLRYGQVLPHCAGHPGVNVRPPLVLADAWLPDLVRLGELERHLGDGVIEAAVDAVVAAGRLKPRQRRRLDCRLAFPTFSPDTVGPTAFLYAFALFRRHIKASETSDCVLRPHPVRQDSRNCAS
jgi:hypothetical protein